MDKEIIFSIKKVLTNGNKINQKNWHLITAKDTRPNTSFFGDPEIDRQRMNGGYYSTWKLKKEKEGFIFREINANTGINGHHKTVREAVSTAVRDHIKIYLEE